MEEKERSSPQGADSPIPKGLRALSPIAQESFQTKPAFFKVLKAPFFVMVFKARALSFTVTNRSISGTQIRFVFKFGVNNHGVLAVTC